MKKIGIMTHHRFYNQGTMLQAYALQKKIETMGHKAEIINYTTENYRNSIIQKIKSVITNPKVIVQRYILKYDKQKNASQIIKTKNKFDEFYRNNIKLSKQSYKTSEELKANPPQYDIYMTGSDQTWSPYIKSNKETYMLDFVQNGKIKTSYAPSIGGNTIPQEAKEDFKNNLCDFSKISCREKKGQEALEKLLEKKVENVLDPTFLLDREEWNKISKPYQRKENNKYMLIYFLGRSKENRKVVKKIAKERKNLPVISIYTFDSGTHKDINTVYGVGPAEFIDLVKNAEYICTDSYHCCIFSIIFNKQFMAFRKRKQKKGSDNGRIDDLLNLFNIKNKIYSKESNINLDDINYEKVNKILQKQKTKSEKFLKECVEL